MFVSINILYVTPLHCFTLLVIVTEEGDRPAENGVETAIKYLAQNNKANINTTSMVSLTGEPEKALRDSKYQILTVPPET